MRYTEALRLYQEAAGAPDVSQNDAITLTHKIGLTQTRLDELDNAMASFDRELALVGKAPPGVQANVEPLIRKARGDALRAKGDPQVARAEYQRALEGYQALSKDAFVASMLADIASTYADEANFGEALMRYDQARRRMEAIKSQEVGRLLVNTSSLLTWLGKYDDALALQAQTEQACGSDRTCQASAAHVQGFTRYQLGEYEAATQASRHAAELFGDTQRVERARALNNLGQSLVALHHPEEALATLKRAMSLLDEAGGNAKDKAAVLDSTASAYRSLKEYKTANEMYQDALVHWRIAGHREGERDTLANLGLLATGMKQIDTAIFYYKLSVNQAQWLRANVHQLEKGYLDSLTRRLSPSYQTLAGLLVDQGRLAEAQQVIRMLKEQELFDFLRRDGPTGDTSASLNGPEQRASAGYEAIQVNIIVLEREREQLNALPSDCLMPLQRARLTELNELIQKARGELERFLAQLQTALGAEGRVTAAVADAQLAGVRKTLKALGQGAVMLHYVPLVDHLSIILTTPQNLPSVSYTIPVGMEKLNRTVWSFRDQIQARSPDAQTTARRLYDWLMPPKLRRDLGDAQAKILMISLTESLRYLPFAALYDGQHWLAELIPVVIYTDAAGGNDLLALPQAQWSVSAFGMTQAVDKFPALSWVHTELESIVGEQGRYGTALFDADFTEGHLHDAVFQQHPPVLHIASHFVFRPSSEEESFLLLGVGRLSLAKLKQWEFSDLDLLTLSACETAVGGGVNLNGHEIEGFAVLAQKQGAAAILATLWPVADISTAAFMQAFYSMRRSSPALSKVEVLQAVQRAMINGEITLETARTRMGVRGSVEGVGAPSTANYAHPYFWAPFVLFGNWR